MRLADVGIWLYYFNMFTAVYRKCGKWWAAYVEEVPGVNTQGATLAEARANLKEALTLILETNRVIEAPRPAAPPNGIAGTLSRHAGHHS